eukprot:TRINITY_DN2486_c0_g1_i1.p1 TRINITY_DN2486_c0_g1~~TRINITY_DN2486_c0_g1_i1.p1  ORF type:complete len:256 (-),score=46.42 TRINITY_DN2486_c0_g1_i1:22-735(-)
MSKRTTRATKRKKVEEEEEVEDEAPKAKKQRTAAPKSKAKDTSKFTKTKLNKFFEEYKDSDEDQIGPVNMERLCQDLNVPAEDIALLVLAWKLKASRMGYFTKEEFIEGMTGMQVDSVDKLREKLDAFRKELKDRSTLREVYIYAFDFAKEKEEQKSIDLDTSESLLLLLLPNNAHAKRFAKFLKLQTTYRVVNIDQWKMFFDFAHSIAADLSDYTEDSAWPVIIDEYVEAVKDQKV